MKSLLESEAIQATIGDMATVDHFALQALDPLPEVRVHALTDEEVSTICSSIQHLIKTRSFKVDKSKEERLYNNFKELEDQYPDQVAFIMSPQQVEVAVTQDVYKDMVARVNSILQDSVQQETLSLDQGTVRLFQEHFTEKLEEIIRQGFLGYECEYKLSMNPEPSLTLRCAKSMFAEFKMNIVQALKDVELDNVECEVPGFVKFLLTPKGKDRLQAIEKRHKVVFDVNMRSTPSVPVAPSPPAPTTFIHPKGCTITVLQDDILKCTTDALVNATNPKMVHKGGMAKAVVQAG
jgi:hypothetical protein